MPRLQHMHSRDGKVYPKSLKLILCERHAAQSRHFQSLPLRQCCIIHRLRPAHTSASSPAVTDLNTSPEATTRELATLPDSASKDRSSRNQGTVSTGAQQQQILKQIVIYQKQDLDENHKLVTLMNIQILFLYL